MNLQILIGKIEKQFRRSFHTCPIVFLEEYIETRLPTLTARELFVLEKRCAAKPLTLRVIGEIVGVTPGRIMQNEHKAIRKLAGGLYRSIT